MPPSLFLRDDNQYVSLQVRKSVPSRHRLSVTIRRPLVGKLFRSIRCVRRDVDDRKNVGRLLTATGRGRRCRAVRHGDRTASALRTGRRITDIITT